MNSSASCPLSFYLSFSFTLYLVLIILSFLLLFKSPVVSVGFARFHPNLLVGGTYSGQIVLWDNRSHRRTPVQRTPLSAAAHTVRTQLMYLPHIFKLILLKLSATTLWNLIYREDFNLKSDFLESEVEPTEVHRPHCAAVPHAWLLSAIHAEDLNSWVLNNESLCPNLILNKLLVLSKSPLWVKNKK